MPHEVAEADEPIWVRWLPWKPPVDRLRKESSTGRLSAGTDVPWQSLQSREASAAGTLITRSNTAMTKHCVYALITRTPEIISTGVIVSADAYFTQTEYPYCRLSQGFTRRQKMTVVMIIQFTEVCYNTLAGMNHRAP